ncbi:hypothetical protein HYPDE_35098 [Hyphomicrobium denitrificans 1NES1]|uniref:Lipoprotein n=2 Tax=Hyphomicrobium denitrificans TaxID=53399 RepID=N0BDW2_9HYPH|nr:hypothetical protein HYPDE_35098 [Hyphomicrobium denitrificans 1NES1]
MFRTRDMKQTFVCRTLALASFLAFAGCAQDSGSRPSYIGLSDLTAAEASALAAPAEAPSDATRYVQSNKVLSAMAFQRVTGRTIDPERLSGHE